MPASSLSCSGSAETSTSSATSPPPWTTPPSYSPGHRSCPMPRSSPGDPRTPVTATSRSPPTVTQPPSAASVEGLDRPAHHTTAGQQPRRNRWRVFRMKPVPWPPGLAKDGPTPSRQQWPWRHATATISRRSAPRYQREPSGGIMPRTRRTRIRRREPAYRRRVIPAGHRSYRNRLVAAYHSSGCTSSGSPGASSGSLHGRGEHQERHLDWGPESHSTRGDVLTGQHLIGRRFSRRVLSPAALRLVSCASRIQGTRGCVTAEPI